MPNRPIFSQLFARSPISPIQEHMKVAQSAAAELPAFFTAVFNGDWDKAEASYELISKLESEADDIKRKVRSNLPSTLFMPVSRTDLLELLQAQDKIPNQSQDVAGLCLGRQMEFPEVTQDLMIEFVASVTATVSAAGKALSELDELLESGFSGTEIELIENMITDLNKAEHENDVLLKEVRHVLYRAEQDMNPVDVMFIYRLIESLGEIADHAQSVGNRMLYLIAK